MTKDTSGPAFPTLKEHGFNDGVPGMTLRDYFAAKAMQTLLAKEGTTLGEDARVAYMMADAMLAERSRND